MLTKFALTGTNYLRRTTGLILLSFGTSTVFRKIAFVWLFLALSLPFVSHATEPGSINLPAPANDLARKMFNFHTYWLLPIVFGVSIFVIALLIYTCIRFHHKNNPKPRNFTHNVKLEVLWTIVPVLILLTISIPSIRLLQATDNFSGSEMTIKITGYQWYWNYAYPDEGELNFDSYMIPEDEITPDQLRLMSVDQPLVIPANTKIRLLFTSADVIHSWAVQEFGVRMDAVPGLLNEFPLEPISSPGTYFGFCSELCGDKHAYMPIEIKVIDPNEYEIWLDQAKKSFVSSRKILTPKEMFAQKKLGNTDYSLSLLTDETKSNL